MPPAPTNDMTDRGARLVDTVASWPSVAVGPHRIGTAEFTLDGREFGHTHGARVVDINFPKRVADRLIAADETNEHRFAGGGWTSFEIADPEDVDAALRLLRLSYLFAALTMRRTPAGAAALSELDLDAEIDALELDDEIVTVVERMRP